MHARDQPHFDAERRDANAEQEGDHLRVGRHFTAQGQRLVLGEHRRGNALQGAQYRRMVREVEIGDVLVRTVHGEDVLHEVVAADRQEIRLVGEFFRDFDGGRQFQHRPELRFVVVGDAVLLQLLQALAHDVAGLDEIVDGRNQREHDPQLHARAGAQECAQLLREDFLIPERKPDRAEAQERVRLARIREVGEHLVAADIEGAELDFLALHLG